MRIFRLAIIIFTLMAIMMFCTGITYAGTDSIKIKLDGVELVSDSPPVIVDGRTLVPTRVIFEAMDGTVKWDSASKKVTIDIQGKTIELTVDSKIAYINGTKKEIDVPAKIINNRTMVPVRFISEAIGCNVTWDSENRVVDITSAEAEDLITINKIKISKDKKSVEIYADNKITDYKSFQMTDPDRLILDIGNANLELDNGSIKASDNPYIKTIRYSQYTNNSVRIVADLKDSVSGTVSKSDTQKIAYITFEEGGNSTPSGIHIISAEDQAILDQYDLLPVEEEAQQKLIVIDPGHGGTDTGSRGYENGVAVLNEKDINLDIALRVQEMLEAAGANVYMIRTADTTIALYDRQDKANSLGASLYVAIHNNSFSTATPSGTEVLYYSKDQPTMDGISGYELAEDLQSTLISNLGLVDRGTKADPSLAVLRRTTMPAVIIEGAFISNPDNLNYMKTDEFRELYAKSVAKCVIEALNDSIE